MRFYTNVHEAYCGIDLHTRTMYVCMKWLRVLQTGLTSCRMWKNLILQCGSTSFT